jgi:cobalamin synthase
MVGLLIYRCVCRLGGVTGDVMGAAIEIAFTVMITVLII